jgi:hypothetical protein
MDVQRARTKANLSNWRIADVAAACAGSAGAIATASQSDNLRRPVSPYGPVIRSSRILCQHSGHPHWQGRGAPRPTRNGESVAFTEKLPAAAATIKRPLSRWHNASRQIARGKKNRSGCDAMYIDVTGGAAWSLPLVDGEAMRPLSQGDGDHGWLVGRLVCAVAAARLTGRLTARP